MPGVMEQRFQARARGMERKEEEGGVECGEACNSLKHHASFLSEGLCWLPSRWFTGPWRSRFVLLPETGFLDSASRHSAEERERERKKIHLNKSFNLLSFVFVLKKKKKWKNLPDVRTCRFLHWLDLLSTTTDHSAKAIRTAFHLIKVPKKMRWVEL